MAETIVAGETQQGVAVVTGANKGIGLEIVRQLLASGGGISVLLTSRDECRGLEAVEKLKQQQQLLPAQLEFHRLDVTDAGSVAELANFIKTRFGKLDILVNNAAVSGFVSDPHRPVISPAASPSSATSSDINPAMLLESKMKELQKAATLGGAREAIDINFYGTKRTTEALLPLLLLSSSPRVVNVSSAGGLLQNIPNDRVREELNGAGDGILTEGRLDELLQGFLADFGDGKAAEQGWPPSLTAYRVSKAALNAYTRILAGANPGVAVNCVHPGFVRTDMTGRMGPLSSGEGAANVVRVALLPHGGPSGVFFNQSQLSATF